MRGRYLATKSSHDTSCCEGSLNKSGITVKECARHSGLKSQSANISLGTHACFKHVLFHSSMRNKTRTHDFWENRVHYPRVFPGAHPLTKKPEDSGYEIGLWAAVGTEVSFYILVSPANTKRKATSASREYLVGQHYTFSHNQCPWKAHL